MSLRTHKTKIAATIGSASDAPDVLEQMIRAGMSVTRLPDVVRPARQP